MSKTNLYRVEDGVMHIEPAGKWVLASEAEALRAELDRLRAQEPVAEVRDQRWLDGRSTNEPVWLGKPLPHGTKLYAAPVPHPAITHCDSCGCDWLDNGLNPIGCPYCKPAAVPDDVAKDAARYRFLRDCVSNTDTPQALVLDELMGQIDELEGNDYSDALDAAIDEAMRAAAQEGKP